MTRRTARGGKTVYGACVGIVILDTRMPRISGDVGNAHTWNFPVIYRRVEGATVQRVIHEKGAGLSQTLLDAAMALVKMGADGIATTGGYLSLFQKELAAHVGVPVATSSLMQIPWVQALLPAGKRVGVLTLHAPRLTPEHLVAAGAAPDTPVVGTENGQELTRVLIGNEMELDVEKAEDDMLAAAAEMLTRYPDVGAFVLECHNMAPYSRLVSMTFNMPVFDVYTLVSWFHSGLSPRDFGYPDNRWRERS
jgi:Asp/Glu/hydantoin racemase